MRRFNGGSQLLSFRNTLRILSDSETEMASVTHLLEREENAMTWARISNLLTVQFAKILREKRRGEDLKKGKKYIYIVKFGNLLGIFYGSQSENATVTHRYTQEDENKESKMTWA